MWKQILKAFRVSRFYWIDPICVCMYMGYNGYTGYSCYNYGYSTGGNYRRKTIILHRYLLGLLTHELSIDMTDSFDSYPEITESILSTMTTADYLIRLSAFYTYLESTYSWFSQDEVLLSYTKNAYGTSSYLQDVVCRNPNTNVNDVNSSGLGNSII